MASPVEVAGEILGQRDWPPEGLDRFHLNSEGLGNVWFDFMRAWRG